MTAIVHVVCWRLNGTGPEQRAGQAEAVVAAVEAMRGVVPGLLALDAGRNVVDAADAFDVGAVMVFRSRDDLAAYQDHPAHRALKAVVAPLRSARGQFDIQRATSQTGASALPGAMA